MAFAEMQVFNNGWKLKRILSQDMNDCVQEVFKVRVKICVCMSAFITCMVSSRQSVENYSFQ